MDGEKREGRGRKREGEKRERMGERERGGVEIIRLSIYSYIHACLN